MKTLRLVNGGAPWNDDDDARIRSGISAEIHETGCQVAVDPRSTSTANTH